jgi:hypothetical protein
VAPPEDPGGTPVAGADPTPPPVPVQAGGCELPPADVSKLHCWKLEPELLGALEAAITAATQAHPENYDFGDTRCGNCYYVQNSQAYYAEVARQLQLRGVCSVQDRDEITLKSTNGWSEQFDILLGSGHIRRGAGAYLYSCSPAMF